MSKIDDGGPAFPRPGCTEEVAGCHPKFHTPAQGMSLRDLFAGLFLHAIVLKEGCVSNRITRSMTGEDRVRDAGMFAHGDAERAYIYADAMLSRRRKVQP